MAIEIAPSALLADLDGTLARLVGEQLRQLGHERVAVVFEPPAAAWAASTPRPVVNLFLYDLREVTARRAVDWTTTDQAGRAVQPPLRLEISYAVTVWAETVVDEHGLLSDLLAVLHAHRVLPAEAPADGSQAPGLEAAIARPHDDLGARLVALGAAGKPALRYTVLASVPGGGRPQPAPEVQRVHTRLASDHSPHPTD